MSNFPVTDEHTPQTKCVRKTQHHILGLLPPTESVSKLTPMTEDAV